MGGCVKTLITDENRTLVRKGALEMFVIIITISIIIIIIIIMIIIVYLYVLFRRLFLVQGSSEKVILLSFAQKTTKKL